jgi:ABC-2 type transport system ATP-binding protein
MILKTLHLSKKRKNGETLEDISISISKGKITGVIGAENSGKTTLLQILGGRIKPDSGTFLFEDKPVSMESFRRVSYLSEGDILPGFCTGKKLIHFVHCFYPDFSTEKAYSYAETLKIQLTQKVGALSQQKRELLKTILCLSRECPLFLIDNPFMMLDKVHFDLLTTVIFTSIQPTKSLIITSRDPALLEVVCDDFLLLSGGKAIFYGDGEDFRLHRSESMSAFYKKALMK